MNDKDSDENISTNNRTNKFARLPYLR
jgi:hypothetical protein